MKLKVGDRVRFKCKENGYYQGYAYIAFISSNEYSVTWDDGTKLGGYNDEDFELDIQYINDQKLKEALDLK